MATDNKYDRLLRLWSARGQKAYRVTYSSRLVTYVMASLLYLMWSMFRSVWEWVGGLHGRRICLCLTVLLQQPVERRLILSCPVLAPTA